MSKRQDREKMKKQTAREARRAALRAKNAGKMPVMYDHESALKVAKGSREAYVQQWFPDAQGFETRGDYDWMAEQISGFTKVLEIGCGTGQSTVAIIRAGHTVISVDENDTCVKATLDAVRAAGFTATAELRGTVHAVEKHHYAIDFSKPQVEPLAQGATVIEGDILRDPQLEEWLSQNSPFDAVVCWMIGTHGVRAMGVDAAVRQEARGQPGIYRLQVHNSVYRLANTLLRPGGVLHIVDRGAALINAEIKEMVVNLHTELSEGLSDLQLEDPTYRLLPEANTGGGIRMKFAPTTAGSYSGAAPYALVSVRLRKPQVAQPAM